MNIYVPGRGPNTPKIMLVGECPNFEDETTKEPFSGARGRFLHVLLQSAGLTKEECWRTYVSKLAVPPNSKGGRKIPFVNRAKVAGVDLEKQIQDLRVEISQVNPNVIVPLGQTALWAVTGKSPIQKFRGSILHGMGKKVIPTYDPANILYQDAEVSGYWNKQVCILDLKRIKEESHFADIRLPNRTLRVVKNSGELYEFIQKYRHAQHPAIDIEAYHCVPVCVGISFEPSYGITVPLWNTEGISKMSNKEIVNCWVLLAQFLSEQDVIGQNFGYDRDKLNKLGFPVRGLHSDTMLKSFVLNPEWPKNLAFNVSIRTREPYYKDEGMYEGSFDDLFIGCARDACVTKEVDISQQQDIDELGLDAYYRQFIIPLHSLYAEIEQTGFRTDDDGQRAFIQKYIEWSSKIDYELFKLAGTRINVNSPKQVASLLYETWGVPIKAGVGEDQLTAILNGKIKNDIHRLGIEKILEKRRVDKALGTYGYCIPDYDGRMRTSYFICLKTGRSSTSQQEPPIRPIVEYRDKDGKKKTQARGVAFQTITKHGDIGPDIRKIFIPDEGEIFLQVDSAQAEARVIFLLAEDYEALNAIDTCDYHALTASWFFGGTEQTHSKKVLGYESPMRFAGKTLRHACHLGAGAKRAAATVNTDAKKAGIDYKITEAFAKQAIEIFHKKQPSIKQVFQKGIIDCLRKNRTLYAPVPYGIQASVGGRRIFYDRDSDELYRDAFSYIPQRTVSENTKGAALRVRAKHPWIKIIVEAHDGILASVPIERKLEAARILKSEMEVPIDFSTCSLKRGVLIIPAEVEEGMNYKELVGMKL